MKFSKRASEALQFMIERAVKQRHEYVTPEHLLYGIARTPMFESVALIAGFDRQSFLDDLDHYLDTLDSVKTVGRTITHSVQPSFQGHQVMQISGQQAEASGHAAIDIVHFIFAILQLRDSHARNVLYKHLNSDDIFILNIFKNAQDVDDTNSEDVDDDQSQIQLNAWHTLVREVDFDPDFELVGRKEELNRTIQILGRKNRHNVLHIGEPGVGKSALIQGLVHNIYEGKVPDFLIGCTVYALDPTILVAGAQMRGEFEKRLKIVLEGAARQGNAIIYIDDIHTLASTGQGDGSMDAMTVMKPYLDSDQVRFIGTTSYQEFNRRMAKNKSFCRRFQEVEIKEPSVEETMEIITAMVPQYEKYHKVRYTPEALRHAVEKSHLLVADRNLPDKAIDIIDEAGALRHCRPLLTRNLTPRQTRYQKVDVDLVNEVLAKVCKINARALASNANEELEHMDEHIKSQIFGQDEAVDCIVESVQMAKAGLTEPDKPMASLLFVGPTGVGKTEVCKVLADELNIPLVRFDMSEYTEKHTVAKLIGSPAGYVGYDDGGLLTDAIRKTPNCVLLLDEIEKAHSDIYNILLQVMDYAKLTDSKGNKADFKNVILVMTSNAGAQYASQSSVGFSTSISRGESMLGTVKKIFKPEFLNRLSGTVVFRDMTREMASLILDKKLRQLQQRLESKHVTLSLTPEARDFLLQRGFTTQYGAREMDRVLLKYLNPVLMREILFGKLKKGGSATISLVAEQLTVNN